MSNRQKTVFHSDEIAHIWAHQMAPYGRSPGNVSFSGAAISSYSTEMARFIEHKGKRAVIINDTSYSLPTSRAQGQIRRAIPDYITKFHIGYIGRGCSLLFGDRAGSTLFEYAIKQATHYAGLAANARQRKDTHLGSQAYWLDEAKKINEFFGLRRKVDEKSIERLRSAEERAIKKRIADADKMHKKRLKELEPLYQLWKDGDETIRPYHWAHYFPTAFRIEGEELVSTYGARVSLRAARLALRFIEKRRETGWKANGEQYSVGGYRFVEINPDEVVIGCHHITWAEVDRIAPLIAKATEGYLPSDEPEPVKEASSI